ncbi:GspE/PulE family protein [Candidatus Magnetomonas plexicatena]|uniref:GspE/PulE family protein n=1 Tax=Candidatus Magnetomonas plexicatena TaxID=2552947 RepID=UPI0040328F07
MQSHSTTGDETSHMLFSSSQLIGQILVDKLGIRQEEIAKALDVQKEIGGFIGQILISTGAITDYQLIESLSFQLGIEIFDRDSFGEPKDDLVQTLTGKLNVDYLIKSRFVPIELKQTLTGLSVTLITNDPLNAPVIDYITMALNADVTVLLATEQTINEFSRPFRVSDKDLVSLSIDDNPELLKEMASEAPVIKFLNNLLSSAVELRASDIHIEPSESAHRIKMRIDGVLHETQDVEDKLYLAIISRIKLLAGLDIAEKRLPQDGKFSTKIASALIDIRVSSIPFAIGEGVVMRLLYRERLTFDITKLGIEPDVAPLILEMINVPFGILLVTGPTGSGKTTSLYSMISTLDRKEKKIITVEDPVEYKLDGINQIQVKSEIALTFAAALRSILRHDPDVIMVGEIRDPETAEVAVQSALTGHLVLSTLHTNDAPSSLFRLIEMGLEDYLLNASVLGIIAQRIVRRNCPHCSVAIEAQPHIVKKYNLDELIRRFGSLNLSLNLKKGNGCKKCSGTGYRGMLAIYEVFKYTEDLKELFIKEHSIVSLKRRLVEAHNFRTLREDGLIKVISGITTIEEVLRVS